MGAKNVEAVVYSISFLKTSNESLRMPSVMPLNKSKFVAGQQRTCVVREPKVQTGNSGPLVAAWLIRGR
jgi:hypothetical protein